MTPSLISKLVVAAALGATILAGVLVRPPRRTLPRADLRVIVLAALGLYGVGLAASLSHHVTVAMLVYVSGIAMSSLAAWLSRGRGPDEPPRGDEPDEWPPPTDPTDYPEFDWDAFERDLGVYTDRRERQPVLTR